MELSKFNSSLLPLILGCTTFFPEGNSHSPHSATPTSDPPLHCHPAPNWEDQGTASYFVLPHLPDENLLPCPSSSPYADHCPLHLPSSTQSATFGVWSNTFQKLWCQGCLWSYVVQPLLPIQNPLSFHPSTPRSNPHPQHNPTPNQGSGENSPSQTSSS
jgi:hypothetical protein